VSAPRDPVQDLFRFHERMGFERGRRGLRRSYLLGLLTGMAIVLAWAFWSPAVAQVPLQAEQHRRELVRSAQRVWGMDAPISALAAQVAQESAWNPLAKSWVGAAGLTQFMPQTAASMARLYPQLQPVNVFDPAWSLTAQSLLMRDLVGQFRRYGATQCHDWCYASTGYNGGPGWTLARIRRSSDPSDCWLTSQINPGVAAWAQKENQDYPRRIYRVHEPKYVAAGWGRGVCQ
jgi:soluble lytic murein transglycosylase-like protein